MADFTCIVCPNSCLITVEESDESLKIIGNQCKRGEEFAKNEYTHPMRMFTSTMKIKDAVIPRISVISSGEIPKEKMKEAQALMAETVLEAPVKLGDVLVHDICGTGVDIIASRTLKKVSA